MSFYEPKNKTNKPNQQLIAKPTKDNSKTNWNTRLLNKQEYFPLRAIKIVLQIDTNVIRDKT